MAEIDKKLHVEEKRWGRKCPKCEKILIYKRRGGLTYANKHEVVCIECSFLRRKPKLERLCPSCNNVINYTTYVGMWGANKRKTVCLDCRKLNNIKKKINGWVRNCPCGRKILYKEKWMFNRAIKKNCVSCIKCRGVGHFHSKKTKMKISLSKLNNPNKKETSKKMRISAINRIRNRFNICHPNYNLDACKYFVSLEKEKGWNGKYATKNGGEHYIPELGYFVDYYEPSHNIVVEYDEPRHISRGKLKTKDVNRMEEIKRYLQCRFYRYNVRNNELKEY
jgi:hypothetical protein